jgi:hypothetical protein
MNVDFFFGGDLDVPVDCLYEVSLELQTTSVHLALKVSSDLKPLSFSSCDSLRKIFSASFNCKQKIEKTLDNMIDIFQLFVM